MRKRSAGWYADPVTVGAARYWDGRGWTDLIAWGGSTRHDRTPLSEVERLAARADARTVSDYITDAERRGIVSRGVAAELLLDVERSVSDRSVVRQPTTAPTAAPAPSAPARKVTPDVVTPPATASPPTRPADLPSPVASASPISTTAPGRPDEPPAATPPSTPPSTPRPAAPPRREPVAPLPRQPGRIARWWAEAHRVVRSDLALHGLAYLGVLLLFAGVTGLIAFSFGDVDPWVRSLAEFLVPTALFVAAGYLARRGASVVATALTLLGGAITPIVVTASLTDGAPFPPDLSGRTLPIVQGITVAVVAVAMTVVVRRSPSSPLRFVAGPAMWMAAGLAAGAARTPVPTGYDAARPDSLQLAVIMVALMLTVVACSSRRAPEALAAATRTVALPVAAVLYVIELVLAGTEGWPLASTLTVGIALLLLLELVAGRFPAYITSSLQFVVVAVGAARLAATAAPEWVAVGAALSLLALVEYAGWRRPAPPVETAGLLLAGTAFLLTLVSSPSAAVAFGALTAWGLWRHAEPAEWFPTTDELGIVAAVAAVVTTVALRDLAGDEPTLVVTAATLLVAASAGRVWRSVADDPLWRWFVPASAGATLVMSATLPFGDAPVVVAAAAAMLAIAIALTALPVAGRVWTASGALVWSAANLAEALDAARSTQAVVLATAGLAMVVGSLVVARPICAHIAAVGHVVGIAALLVPLWPGWDVAVVMAAVTAGFWATAFVDERGDAVHLGALRSALDLVPSAGDGEVADVVVATGDGEVMPCLSLVGTWATVVVATDAAGWIEFGDPWVATISAGVGLGGAGLVRAVSWRRARRGVLEWFTLLVAGAAALAAVSAAGSDRDHWSPVAALAFALAVVLVTAPPRPLAFVWTGWVGGAAASLFLLDRLGLDRDWTDVAVAGWGAAALIGGLAVHRVRIGPLPAGTFVRDRLLLPPVVLGAGAFAIGGILGLSEGSDAEIGWTAAGMSLVVLVAALLIPLGALVAAAEALATGSYVLLAPWEPLDRPWTFAPWTAVLLGAALATRRPGEWSVARWDLPSFFVAHGVAALALVTAADSGELAPTFALVGGLSLAIAGVLRRWPWAAAGAVLVLVAGVDAGPGWLALVLLVEGVALTVIGLQQSHAIRWALLALGAVSLVGAWFELAVWRSWSLPTVYYATVPAAALVALLGAAGVRGLPSTRVPVELAGVWAVAGGVVTVGTGLAGIDDVARRPGGLVFAGSLVVLAIAAGATAIVVGGRMRWLAAGVAALAWAPAAWAIEVSERAATLTGTAVGLAGMLLALAVDRRRPGTAWLAPGTFFAAVTQVGAAIAAVSAFPDHDLIRLVLVAVAAESVVLAVLTGRRELHLVSPVPALGAWAFHLGDALAGTADWWGFYATMPAAASVALVAAAGVRWARVPVELAGGWAVAGGAVTVVTGLVGVGEVERLPGGLLFAGSLLVLAVAAAASAVVVGAQMRWAAAGLAATAWVPTAWAVEVSETVASLAGTGIGLLGLGGALVAHGFRPTAVWVPPAAFFAVATQLGAAGTSVSVLPDTGPLIVVLLAAAIELVVLGLLADRPELHVVAPAAALGAWLLYAQESLTGDPSWFTVPIGLAVLIMVGLVRWIRRGRGGDPTGYDVVAVELVGMCFLVGSALARTLAGHLWNSLLAIGAGVLVAGWGAVTRVRRRAAFGAASVVLAVVLVIGVPLTASVTWRGPTLWLTLSVIGIAAIVVASALERGRERLRDVARRLDRMTVGWERIELRSGHSASGSSADDGTASGSDHPADSTTSAPESAARRHDQSV